MRDKSLMLKKFGYRIVVMLMLSAGWIAMGGCTDDPVLEVNPHDLTGRWVVAGTEEYWRFNSNGSGVTWDESEDISEDESNLTFEWSLDRNELTCVFRGENENQAVPKVYYIKEISSRSMRWEDVFGRTWMLNRM